MNPTLKHRLRVIGSILAIGLVAIQFLPPSRNLGTREGPDEIAAKYPVPADVHTLLVDACYDCHSNRTNYPAYVRFQPVGWWMADHINSGKRHLNFSTFGAYPTRIAVRKLGAIANQVHDGDMPLDSYTWMHPPARLTAAQRARIVAWAGALHDQLERH